MPPIRAQEQDPLTAAVTEHKSREKVIMLRGLSMNQTKTDRIQHAILVNEVRNTDGTYIIPETA